MPLMILQRNKPSSALDLGMDGLVDVNLETRITQVPENPNTRCAYIQGSKIEHSKRRPLAWLYSINVIPGGGRVKG